MNKKCKMLGTTNSRFKDRCGTIEESIFSDRNRIFWFGNLHTSYVIECKINENIMTIKTRNSEYIFELLDVQLHFTTNHLIYFPISSAFEFMLFAAFTAVTFAS